jgi:polysaccharide biosynthesis/export protein
MVFLAMMESRRSRGLRAAGKVFRAVMALAVAFPFIVVPAHAQGVSDVLQSLGTSGSSSGTDGLAQQVLRSLGQNGGQSTTPLQPNIQIQNPQLEGGFPGGPFNALQGLPNASDTTGFSPLEKLMSLRVGQRLMQFGYSAFGHGSAVIVHQSGALQDSYVLGEGDEIVATLRGQEAANYRTRVDRDGRVVLTGLPPVPAAGRSFGAFRADLEAAVRHAFVATQVSVSVGTVRQISVRVVGEVNNPGVYSLTGLSSALDALNLAGGIRKTGSLRNIQIVRDGKTLHLDLYNLLTNGGIQSDITLTEGDRIVVPLLASVVAVAGQVRRPAIYELAPGEGSTHVATLLALAGGTQVKGSYRFSLQQTRNDGHREMVPVNADSSVPVRDGDALFVSSDIDSAIANVELAGTIGAHGFYSLGTTPSLRALLKSADMFAPQPGQPLPYLLIAAVERLNPQSLQRTVIPFSPMDVLAGKSDLVLKSNDMVYVLNVAEMRYIARRAAAAAAADAESDQNKDSARRANGNSSSTTPPPASTLQAGAASGIFPLPPAAPAAPAPAPSPPAAQTPALPGSLTGGTLNPYAFYPGGWGYPAMNGYGPLGYSALSAGVTNGRGIPDDEDLPALNGIAAPADGSVSADASDNSAGEEDTAASASANPSLMRRDVYAFGQRVPGATTTRRPTGLRLFVGLDDDERQLLINTLSNYYVLIDGEVTNPGAFLAMPGVGLDEVTEAAGGVTPNVDLSGFEISSSNIDNRSGVARTVRKSYQLTPEQFSQVVLKPLDRIRFNKVFSDNAGEASLFGELRYPGSYSITRGEHLSTLLARAGGLTADAYSYGAIFLRRSVAEQERGVLQREADTLESQLVGLMGTLTIAKTQVSDGEVTYITQLAQKMRQADGPGGRVAVVIDPKMVATHPELDVVLEPGDRLFVPRKPNSVVVAGEVMSPNGIQFQEGLSVEDYVARAGGNTDVADDGHTFVIQPDGSAFRADGGSWLEDPPKLAPGSVIVVPRDLRPFDWNVVLENVIQLTSQLAITAASISVISN